jgi:3-isopropylmalate/(R)-2-methylmalate dehydratase small subunit
MEPFARLSGVAAPLLMDDINTDQISPATTAFAPDYAALLFARWRTEPDFVLNREQFQRARILVARRNFGCGSSRESAVWALAAFGIRCVVARSFGDMFRDNVLKNGLLPVTLDDPTADEFEREVVAADGRETFTVNLETQSIACPSGWVFHFPILPADRNALLRGLDDIGLTLEHGKEIEQWEQRMRATAPWAQSLPA